MRLLVTAMAAALAVAPMAPSVSAHDNARNRWIKVIYNGYDHWIRWKFDSTFPAGDFRSRVSEGRSKWNAVGRELWYSWEQSSSATKFEVSYEDLLWPNGDAWAIATPISNFGELIAGSIAFNSTPQGYSWNTTTNPPTSSQGDAISIAAHEFGHLVMLAHSGQSADVMWPYINAGQSKRTLTAHDKDGISWLYAAH